MEVESKNLKRKEPEAEPDFFFPVTDWEESFYRVGYGGYQVSDLKSALQKDIRRNNAESARFFAMVLLASHKVENLVNRLTVIASEDISIADNRLVLLAKTTQNLYMAKRGALEKSGAKGAWKELRNDLELRYAILQLVTELSNARKSRITDHALSYHCFPLERDDEPIYAVLPPGINARSTLSVPAFGAILDEVIISDVWSEALERKAFEEVRKILRPPVLWSVLPNKRPAINFQKKKLAAAFAELNQPCRVQRLARKFDLDHPRVVATLRALCDIALHRMQFASAALVPKGLPGKVQLCHSILLFTRAYESSAMRSYNPPAPFIESPAVRLECTARFAALIAGVGHIPIPRYALDQHTNKAIDRSLEGFFRREHEALTPIGAINDPYRVQCLAMARNRDRGGSSDEVVEEEEIE